MTETARPHALYPYVRPGTMPFWGVHLTAIIGVALLGFSWEGLAWATGSYFLRIFFVTAAYHRYFSHRTFKTSRPVQFVMAFMAQTSIQKGVLWWAAHHRQHHRFADKPGDPHSPRHDGLFRAHLGWLLDPTNDVTHEERVPDLTRHPELVWISRNHLLPPVLYAVALFLIGGTETLIWGFFVSSVFVWHGTFTINSLTHIFGRPRFASDDDSKNSWSLALLTLGEGWHNNHHHYQSCARQGFYWWEIDITYYIIKMLS